MGRERHGGASRGSGQPSEDGWTPDRAEAEARRLGIRLTGRHWKVIAGCREEAARTGRTPDPERLRELAGMGETELGRLFGGDPAATAAALAGLAGVGRRERTPSLDRKRNEREPGPRSGD